LDSSDPDVALKAMNGFTTSIGEFHISDFDNAHHQIGRFYGNFSQDTLTVFSPIAETYKVHGYILIHKPVAKILESSYEISNFIFYAAMAVYGCSFLILLTYLLSVRRPIHKISTVARKYAKGNFSEKITIDSNDEIGDLANTMNFMATELNTLEEEQRTFISNISHDFRSPLTSIKGYTEAMLDGTIPPEMQEKYLNIILF
jgi:signal transduction histidine kinase